jgi:predicted TIM-barrel fold metal-dependent hydrolase
MKTNRRDFLRTSLATGAACGLARFSFANNVAGPDSIVDTHAYVGHWPHATLPSDDVSKFVTSLRSKNISQAWVGSFDALFHKDIAGVNQLLAESCSRSASGMFVPFGAVNPMFPDWEEDVRRCHEVFHMSGIRLHPNYHGYSLDDPRFARLLDLAATRGLIVQLVVSLEIEKHLWLNPRTPAVDLTPLATAPGMAGMTLIIAGAANTIDGGLTRELARKKNVYFDFAGQESPLNKLIGQISIDRLLFGSAVPLHAQENSMSLLMRANLNDKDKQAIQHANARKLITMK